MLSSLSEKAPRKLILRQAVLPDLNFWVRREILKRIIQTPEGYLRMAYQPIMNVKSGKIFGFEALARVIQTDVFKNILDLLTFAEKVGHLYPLETLCRRLGITSAGAVLGEDEILFLNISPEVLNDPEFARGQTRKMLASCGLRPSNVVLEITERSSITDFDVFRKALTYYRNQGFRIALDDVGAGYSSLQAVAEVHPDFLKIDRSLISGVNHNPIKFALIETFVAFSKRIGCQIIAEGVETLEEYETVNQLGVDFIQGYFVGIPDFVRTEINGLIRVLCDN